MYELEERMKMYEKNYSPNRLMPNLPALIRLDGKAFHTLTRNCIKPFDCGLHGLMTCVLESLVLETNAVAGYTQSDEITLLLHSDDFRSQIYFDGKRDKINSILAAKASIAFNDAVRLSDHQDKYQHDGIFDCRCWNVPNKTEACNVFIWREQDAVRNSISALAQYELGHSKCQNKSSIELQELVFQEKGINWNDLPQNQKNGTFILRKTNNGRREFVTSYLPRLTAIANLENVLFCGETFKLLEARISYENSKK